MERRMVVKGQEEILSRYSSGKRDFSDLDLRGLVLRTVNLNGINFAGADLTNAKIIWCNLQYANLREANLCGANLHMTDLREADLTKADLRNAYMYGALLCGATLDFALLAGVSEMRTADIRKHDTPLPRQEMQRTRQAIPKRVQREVWRRDQGRCVECNGKNNLEFDHMISVSKGGSNTARNIQLLCQECNRKKGDKIG